MAIVIENADVQEGKPNEWGVSLTSSNPLPEDYFACESKEKAFALRDVLNNYASLLAEQRQQYADKCLELIAERRTR